MSKSIFGRQSHVEVSLTLDYRPCYRLLRICLSTPWEYQWSWISSWWLASTKRCWSLFLNQVRMPSWGGDLVKFSVLKFFPRKGCCLQVSRQVLLVDSHTWPQLILETFQNSPFFTFHAVVLLVEATPLTIKTISFTWSSDKYKERRPGCFFFLEKSIFSAFFSTHYSVFDSSRSVFFVMYGH